MRVGPPWGREYFLYRGVLYPEDNEMNLENLLASATCVLVNGAWHGRCWWKCIDKLRIHRLITFLLVGVAVALPAELTAANKKQHGADARVVGHIPFDGTTLVDMALTTGANRQYLYVQHASDGGVSIADVTNFSQPKLVCTTFWPEGVNVGGLTFLGDYVIGEVLPIDTGTAATDTGGTRFVKGFTRVKRAILNEGLVYVLTDTGVWILRAPALGR